jgi:hypothetical protein
MAFDWLPIKKGIWAAVAVASAAIVPYINESFIGQTIYVGIVIALLTAIQVYANSKKETGRFATGISKVL